MSWTSYIQLGPLAWKRSKAVGPAEAEEATASCSASCSNCCTTVTLYHQTSPENAEKILSTGIMKPGICGYGGAGIYFAPEIGATCCKATRKGVILECQVELGRIREIRKEGDWSGKIWRRLFCYDSIKITSLEDGLEYVIFDPVRVRRVQLWRPGVEAAEVAAAVLAQHCAWLLQCVVYTVLNTLQECVGLSVQQQGQQQQFSRTSSMQLSSQKAVVQQQCS